MDAIKVPRPPKLVPMMRDCVSAVNPDSSKAVRVHGRDTIPHHRHQFGRSWHFDRIHGQSYFLPADCTGAATGEEAVFRAVHPVQSDLPCDPAERVVLAPLSVASGSSMNVYFPAARQTFALRFMKQKREFCHGRMSGQNSLCVYCMMSYSPSGSLQTSTQPSAPAAASSSCKVSLTAV